MGRLRTALAGASLSLALLALAPGATADPMLADFAYPYPVESFEFSSQRQPLSMAYMDVAPATPNGKTALLLHGKNFCAATWETVIGPLRDAGYRVVAPDQIGFCKSSKPAAYQFSLNQLATNTRALSTHLGVDPAIVIGHSMGGMLAIRYALMYPGATRSLVLVNPIGLEDWKTKGVPFATVDELYDGELKSSFETIKRYQQGTYYAGSWRSQYDRWVAMLAGMYVGKGRETVAWDQALVSDMIFSQPVLYELERITAPTLLLIGQKDVTAIGKDRAPPEIAHTLGDYPQLGEAAHRRIKGSILVSFGELGHAPQVQNPAAFNAALLAGLARLH